MFETDTQAASSGQPSLTVHTDTGQRVLANVRPRGKLSAEARAALMEHARAALRPFPSGPV